MTFKGHRLWKRYIEGDVHFLKFEDNEEEPLSNCLSNCAFIGADLTEEVVARIADLTSFKKMKDDNTANMTWIGAFNDGGKSTFMHIGGGG